MLLAWADIYSQTPPNPNTNTANNNSFCNSSSDHKVQKNFYYSSFPSGMTQTALTGECWPTQLYLSPVDELENDGDNDDDGDGDVVLLRR